MNKHPVEKYKQSVQSLDDVVEQKRSEMINDLLQKRNEVASEVELLKKQLLAREQELYDINRKIQALQNPIKQHTGQYHKKMSEIAHHYEDNKENTQKQKKESGMARILSNLK